MDIGDHPPPHRLHPMIYPRMRRQQGRKSLKGPRDPTSAPVTMDYPNTQAYRET